jgi:hypothetical protein
MRLEAALADDNCNYSRNAGAVTSFAVCRVTGTRTVQMNVSANVPEANVSTDSRTYGIDRTVVASTALVNAVTVTGTIHAAVNPNAAYEQAAIGTPTSSKRAPITNKCSGTLTVAMAAATTIRVVFRYIISDDLELSAARQVCLTERHLEFALAF